MVNYREERQVSKEPRREPRQNYREERQVSREPRREEPRPSYREPTQEVRVQRQDFREPRQGVRKERPCRSERQETRLPSVRPLRQGGPRPDINLKPCKFGSRCDRGWECKFLHLASYFVPIQGARRN